MRTARTAFNTILFLTLATVAGAQTPEPAFDRVVIDDDFPGAYQVEVVDIDGDHKLDVVALGGDVCAWYQNPTWAKRIITNAETAPGVITSAAADLNGDGKAEIAIGYDFEMNQPKRGKLLIARQGKGIDEPWLLQPVADVGSIHRLRWGDIDGDDHLDLIVAPIFGPNAAPPAYDDPAGIFAYAKADAVSVLAWKRIDLASRRVTHAIEYHAVFPGARGASFLAANNSGVTLIEPSTAAGVERDRDLVPGAEGPAPKRGASEIHLGRFHSGRLFLATLEPWHGTDVVVWPQNESSFGPRRVIDDTLDDGHALWVADLDSDGQDEILAGCRGEDHRVVMYQFDAASKTWNPTVVDRGIAAQDLRGGDLDGDGLPDVAAVGGSTHNVVLYKQRGKK